MSEWTALIATVVVPVALAWIFRLPRRTMRLAKEVEILGLLEPGSDAHKKLSAHVAVLVDREVEANESALQTYDLLAFMASAAYAISLIVVGAKYGGWGWLIVAMGLALVGVLLWVAVAASLKLLRRWLRKRRGETPA